ncbi:proline-rich protein 36-like [Oreochromis niloticus]|uniref:proline-rich protein 36-like n=1 Tax=Oreochromis niloticus TaxID=8128 RepID=UPI000DF1FCDF|nr:proline-rich protein 36-like [Oreochromis niloticus]
MTTPPIEMRSRALDVSPEPGRLQKDNLDPNHHSHLSMHQNTDTTPAISCKRSSFIFAVAEELKEKQRLFAEREHVFEGTRLALGGPRRRRVLPPAAPPAPEHLPRRVGVSCRASAAPSLAGPLLAHTPSASFTAPSTSPRHSGFASHLGSTETTAPKALLFTPAASSSRRKRRTRRPKMDCFPPSSFDPPLETNNRLISDPWGASLLEDDVDWEELFCSAPSEPGFIKDNTRTSTPPKTVQLKTVNGDGRKASAFSDKSVTVPVYTNPRPAHSRTVLSEPAPSSTCQPVPVSSAQATVGNTQSPKPVSIAHPLVISTPISQPTPTPVPAPRTRAAVTQYTSAPAPVSRVGVTGVQPPPVPVPAPRLRAARTQPDLPRGAEELASPPVSSPLHPPPDPAFHALALSLVRLAEVSPAQAPALLAQAAALSPSVIQSLAQPLASPAQSVPSPAVQVPAQFQPSQFTRLLFRFHSSQFTRLLFSLHSSQFTRLLFSLHSSQLIRLLFSLHSSQLIRLLFSLHSSHAATASRASCELSRSAARGLRARWPGLSQARGLRARWPCGCCSVTAGSHAIAWSSLGSSFCFARSSFCLCVSLAWSCGCHAVAQATFLTSPPPSSSRPPTGPSQWPPLSSSRPPTGSPPASQPATWPPA